MSETVTLHGYRYSVYNRVARMALHKKDVVHNIVEVNPFSEIDPAYLNLHPFGRVPVLAHGTFNIFETSAIIRYVDRAFTGGPLQPESATALARMDQVIGIIDNYGYWPMVRQVFSQRVFRTLAGELSNEEEIVVGLEASHKVLTILDRVAEEGFVLNGHIITLADCYLAPMMDYFIQADEGRVALLSYPSLSRWWEQCSVMPMMQSTDPKLSEFKL